MSDCGRRVRRELRAGHRRAITAVSQFGGAKPNNPNNAVREDGTGARSAPPACSWASAARTTRADSAYQGDQACCMEQLGADIMIGPALRRRVRRRGQLRQAASDEDVRQRSAGAVGHHRCREGARTSSASTVAASSGSAGIGRSRPRSKLGGRRPRSSTDRRQLRCASGAGFIADFCAAGGNITKRVFPPLNTTDYSSFVQQPRRRQGGRLLLAIGGTGTVPSSGSAFENLYGPPTARRSSEPVLLPRPERTRRLPAPERRSRRRLRYGDDLKGAAVTKYKKILDKWFNGASAARAAKASDHAAGRVHLQLLRQRPGTG